MFLEINFEHKILGALFILSYFGAMFIQIRDPKTVVKLADWFLGFLTSIIGSTLMYLFALSWENVGTRMTFTIIASLVSYRTFKFIVSNEAQETFAKGFFKGIMSMLQKLVNNTSAMNENTDAVNENTDAHNGAPPREVPNRNPTPDNNN